MFNFISLSAILGMIYFISIPYICVVIYFLSQVIFTFPLFQLH